MDAAQQEEPLQTATPPTILDISTEPPPVGARLTEKQREFAIKLYEGANNTTAYLWAFPDCSSKKEANNRGRTLARLPKIVEFLAALKSKTLDYLDISPAQITREIGRIALSDIRQLFDAQGEILPINEWPDAIAACVSSYEEEIKPGGIVLKRKVKLWDKPGMLKLAADIKAMTNAKPDATQRATFTFNFGSGKGAQQGRMGGRTIEHGAPPALTAKVVK